LGRPRLTFADAEACAEKVTRMFEAGEFDVCTVIYNRFKSAMTQIVTQQQLIPFAAPDSGNGEDEPAAADVLYEYEPEESEILEALLPRNISVQLFRALLENAASEQGARMTAMDSATRNAGDMIDNLSIQYNRARQAAITK
jgi:F-type H+-transporting ATPase subunit gamma